MRRVLLLLLVATAFVASLREPPRICESRRFLFGVGRQNHSCGHAGRRSIGIAARRFGKGGVIERHPVDDEARDSAFTDRIRRADVPLCRGDPRSEPFE